MTTDEPAGAGSEVAITLAATLQHIEAVHARQAKLLAARESAEEQLLHRLGSAFRCGEIGVSELIQVYSRYKDLDIVGRSKRWNKHVGIHWQSMAAMSERGLNGPEGTWIGDWPVHYLAPAPAKGISVVYVLFDAENEPCYVGSTKNFRQRLNDHAKDGKVFVRWQAYPCRDREHAYQLEDRLLKERLPHLNRKASR